MKKINNINESRGVTQEEWKRFSDIGRYFEWSKPKSNPDGDNSEGNTEGHDRNSTSDERKRRMQKSLIGILKNLERMSDNYYGFTHALSEAEESFSSFGLSPDPDGLRAGVSITDGKKFLNFLRRVSLKDINKNEKIKNIFKRLLVHITLLYKKKLKVTLKDFNNNGFDKFDELSQYRDPIKSEYVRLGMEKDLKKVDLSGPVDAYTEGYLKEYLGGKELLGITSTWLDPSDTIKEELLASLCVSKREGTLDQKIDEVLSRAEQASLKPKAHSLIEITLDKFIEALKLKEDELPEVLKRLKRLSLSEEEILQLLEKLKSTKDDIRNSV